ncbi:cyclic nucleotide-binding domain-containing protein 2-like [Xenopus tropicalis]|uniref:Cyclic nucleotide-binding domain-containing protein 2-like n=1 Tax=Xenopus tropicalis TaxID=8364 RepID=A0A8J1J857_XENTR|nr:cyclic nucleotide-binding domain-containing protein 2-like [Xenopus tropicalis]
MDQQRRLEEDPVMECEFNGNVCGSPLNEPGLSGQDVQESTDEEDNGIEEPVNGEYVIESNLTEASEIMEQSGSEAVLAAHKYLHKFRTAVFVVQVIRSLIKMYRDYAASRLEPISFSEYAVFETNTTSLLFDLSLFKAKMEKTISAEAQAILTNPPEKRTSEGVKMAMFSLRSTVDAFARYPVHIQEKIARTGWYECFGPGRVIIRQGHVPQNFYLILSGTAVVTKVSRNKETGEHFSNTVAFLKKGKYFGDVAILTNAKRNATIVCHETVSLLAISREDFLDIFQTSEIQEGPDYLNLLHSIDLLNGWPIHKLPYNNPRTCVHAFYRSGTVITKDSKASSKIYVIRTGSVRVLKSVTLESLSSSSPKVHKLNIEGTDNEGIPTVTSLQEESVKTPSLHRIQTTKSNLSGREGHSKIFIHIQTLRAGEIFGLVYLVFEDTLGMALVSEGAECISISKDFFKKHMDQEYLHKLSRSIQPYPSKEILKQKIQEYMKWKMYKSCLITKH